MLQEQVAGYENEIRLLNTMKSPKRSDGGKNDGRRKSVEPKNLSKRAQSQRTLGGSLSNLGGDVVSATPTAAVGVLEAALFRPALSEARRVAAKWRNKALSETLHSLPTLSVPIASEGNLGDDCADDVTEKLARLSTAMSNCRTEKASIRVVDLEKSTGRSRAHLRSSMAGKSIADKELGAAVAAVKRCLPQDGNAGTGSMKNLERSLIGRVRLGGKEPYKNYPALCTRDDLYRMNLHVVG